MRRQELHPRTEIINKTQKNKSKKARSEALTWLAETFPQAFDNRLCIRPLKIGIMDDILEHTEQALAAGISKSKLRQAVVLFTRRIDYLTCLKAREMRVDLNGEPASIVTEEEAERAATKIKKRVEKSARNARKNQSGKTTPSYTNKTASANNYHSAPTSQQEFVPNYPERAPAFSAQANATSTAARTAVIVKHKTTRQFDPNAVARLKEKLGLSRKEEKEKESVE